MVITQSSKCFVAIQESGSCTTHGHGDIAIVCDTITHTPDHRVRRFDHDGCGQAARQFPGHDNAVYVRGHPIGIGEVPAHQLWDVVANGLPLA